MQKEKEAKERLKEDSKMYGEELGESDEVGNGLLAAVDESNSEGK